MLCNFVKSLHNALLQQIKCDMTGLQRNVITTKLILQCLRKLSLAAFGAVFH